VWGVVPLSGAVSVWGGCAPVRSCVCVGGLCPCQELSLWGGCAPVRSCVCVGGFCPCEELSLCGRVVPL